jgi:hypothetical protein
VAPRRHYGPRDLATPARHHTGGGAPLPTPKEIARFGRRQIVAAATGTVEQLKGIGEAAVGAVRAIDSPGDLLKLGAGLYCAVDPRVAGTCETVAASTNDPVFHDARAAGNGGVLLGASVVLFRGRGQFLNKLGSRRAPGRSLQGKPDELLRPGGMPIGRPGKSPGIREVTSQKEIDDQFDALRMHGTPTQNLDYGGIGYDLRGGGFVGRRESKRFGPTLDVDIPNVTDVRKIHISSR